MIFCWVLMADPAGGQMMSLLLCSGRFGTKYGMEQRGKNCAVIEEKLTSEYPKIRQ